MDQRKGVLVLVLIALLAQVCNSQDNENKSKTDDKKPKKYSKLDKIKLTKEEVTEKVKKLKNKDKVNDEETSTVKDMSTTAQVAQKKEITNPRDRLSQKLLSNYNKNIHPVKNWKQSVKVDVGMALIHLDLDERHSVVNIDSWMRFNWTDEYLVWDPQDYDGLDQIHFRGQDIWTPDIHLYNNADGANMNHFGDVLYLVYNDGKVLWVPPAKMQAFCKIDLRMWPHESPRCRLKFGSWTSHGDQISLGLFNGKDEVEYLNFYTDNKEWIIVNTTVRLNTNKYPSVEETYPDVTFTFNLKRNSPSYRAGVILPCLITMLLVVTSFLLPPHAGDKLLVNTVSLIICILYLLHFQQTLPAMSDHIPLIVLFYSNTASLVGIAIVLNICCISLTREKRFSAPPKWLRNFFSGFMGKLLCLGNYYHQVSETHQRLVVELDDIQDSPECEQTERDLSTHGQAGSGIMKDWLLVAAGIERFFFLMYSLAFAFVSGFYI